MWVKVERVLNVGGGLGEGEPERVSKGAGPGQPLQLERGHLLEGGDYATCLLLKDSRCIHPFLTPCWLSL